MISNNNHASDVFDVLIIKRSIDWDSLDKKLDNMLEPGPMQVPGIGVIVLRAGKEVYSHYAGWARVPQNQQGNSKMAACQLSDGIAFTEQSRFRAASVSKQFTIFTIMQLVEAGKVDLDEDISRYLGFDLRNPAFPNKAISVKMLAAHTSGLRDGKVYSIPPEYSVREFFTSTGKYWEKGKHFDGEHEPGQYFEYCNLNYGLLGTIIEAVTGQRFDSYQEEHILKQLDIHGKYLPGNFSEIQRLHLGTIYQKADGEGKWDEAGLWYSTIDAYGDKWPNQDVVALQNPYAPEVNDEYSLNGYRPGNNATMFSPQGGLRLSCAELAHAVSMLGNQGMYNGCRVLRPESIDTIQQLWWRYDAYKNNGNTYGDTILAYGLGSMLLSGCSPAHISRNQGVSVIGHTGEAFGLLSSSFQIQGTPYSFVYMMNGEAIAEDKDYRSAGIFSANYIWEETVMDAICSTLFE